MPLSTTRPASLHVTQSHNRISSPSHGGGTTGESNQETEFVRGTSRRRRHQRNKSHGGVVAYMSSTSPKHSPVVDRRVSCSFMKDFMKYL